MNWIAADLLMFVCSVAVYVSVRKAALNNLSSQFNNLAMFAIPLAIFAVAGFATGTSYNISLPQGLEIIGTAIVFSYLGNALSMRSISVAPNAGYSLVLSKSYVVMTTLLAVAFLHASLTLHSVIAIALIVIFSAVIITSSKVEHHSEGKAWIPLAIGAFFCWGFLSLMAKHLISQGLSTIEFLTYVFAIVVVCILAEMKYKKVELAVIKRHIWPFILIGVAAAGFNFFNFYAIKLAPNVGYVNATNAASIGAVTVISAALFKDELTKQKLVGVVGIIAGLLLLFI